MQLPSKTCQAHKIPAGLVVDIKSVFDLGYLEASAKQYQIVFKEGYIATYISNLIYCSGFNKHEIILIMFNYITEFFCIHEYDKISIY